MGEWSRRRAAKRIKPGTGRELQQLRWWQSLSRSLYSIALGPGNGRQTVYTVDVRHRRRIMADDGKGTADLYLDGRHEAESKLPAAFPVPGGTIEVAESRFGLKRCHYVTAGGHEHQLTPDRTSAEGRRAHLAGTHPVLSRAISATSVVLLLISILLLIPQVIEVACKFPPVADRFGTFVSPVALPTWLNSLLSISAVLASIERALRLRHSWFLDTVR
ncbi:hypothetical protein GCM10018793_68170 [Streptomyces sulfonofaciens]|uniref:Uncharacterized protein n=1 Tax=Streptomyces sulfonofaciens TaxID=68272 RepID=A0A919GQZ0_9ACTN|nr:hypothetical protein [Streptomyces sulfonofaciens]GHH88456.1 hypothetical protein GCM10018793_68170 [Streptomyces sulfonofaciens]